MTIHLSKELERFVYDAILAGRYGTEDEVVNDALERLRRQTQLPAKGMGSIGAIGEAAESLGQVVERAMKDAEERPITSPDLTPEDIADQELQRRLLAAGIISEIKPPITDMAPYQNRRAIPIQGEPLSATVIRERR
jgi:putative addiction module CopG family antidote